MKQIPNIDDPMLRNKLELLLQTSLGNPLRAAQGWSTESVKHAYMRALQLCKESGLDELTFPAVFGLWTWNFVRAAMAEAQALAEHLLNAAAPVDDFWSTRFSLTKLSALLYLHKENLPLPTRS